ncbi:MAG: hypothetical protein ACRYGA_13495 [Janthinobacterium lividum]
MKTQSDLADPLNHATENLHGLCLRSRQFDLREAAVGVARHHADAAAGVGEQAAHHGFAAMLDEIDAPLLDPRIGASALRIMKESPLLLRMLGAIASSQALIQWASAGIMISKSKAIFSL